MAALQMEKLLAELDARIALMADGALAPGQAVEVGGKSVLPARHFVERAELGFRLVRLFSLPNGDEWVAIQGGGSADGVYLLNHEAGLFSAESLDEELDLIESLDDIDTLEDYTNLSADEKIACFEETFEFERVYPSNEAFLEALEVRTWETTQAQVAVAVHQLAAAGSDNPNPSRILTVQDTAWLLGFSEVHVLDEEGIHKRLDGPWIDGCVHDDALWWISSKALFRCSFEGEVEEVPRMHTEEGMRYRCIQSGHGQIWIGGKNGHLFEADGEGVRYHSKAAAADIHGVAPDAEGLWIAPWSRGLKYLDLGKNKVRSGGVRAGKLRQVLVSQTGAVLVVCQGKDNEPGSVYRRPPGEKEFTAHVLPEGCIITELAQLPDGRLVGAAMWNKLLASDDDGCTFADVEHDFMGSAGGKPRKRDFVAAAAVGDRVVLGGPFAPLLSVR